MRRSAFWEASYGWILQWSLKSIQWCSSNGIKVKLNTTRGRTCFGPGRLFCVGIKLVWAFVRIPEMGQWFSCSRIMHTYPLIIKHWNCALLCLNLKMGISIAGIVACVCFMGFAVYVVSLIAAGVPNGPTFVKIMFK